MSEALKGFTSILPWAWWASLNLGSVILAPLWACNSASKGLRFRGVCQELLELLTRVHPRGWFIQLFFCGYCKIQSQRCEDPRSDWTSWIRTRTHTLEYLIIDLPARLIAQPTLSHMLGLQKDMWPALLLGAHLPPEELVGLCTSTEMEIGLLRDRRWHTHTHTHTHKKSLPHFHKNYLLCCDCVFIDLL